MVVLAILAGGVIVLVVRAGQKRMTAENSSVYSQPAATQVPTSQPPAPADAAGETLSALPVDAVSAKDDLALLMPRVDAVSARDSTVPAPDRVEEIMDGPEAEDASAMEDPPTGSILATPAKQTTRLLEPLNQDGSLNFVAALDDGYRREIDPQRNAAVPLMQIMPIPGRADIRHKIFEGLGITGPAPGQGFIRPRAYLISTGMLSHRSGTPH